MNIGIDGRCLIQTPLSGVGTYTENLLNTIFIQDDKNEYFVFCNSKKIIDLKITQKNNVHLIYTHYPNKIFNLLVKLNLIKLDRWVIKNYISQNQKEKKIKHLDYWFSPNFNFTALSNNCRHILTIHDLSFEFYPEFYTLKQRFWHYFLNPKKQCRRAHLILAQSNSTKNDLIYLYKILKEKIEVIYPGIPKKLNKTNFDWGKYAQIHNLKTGFLLYLGANEPRKNILGILQAYEILCEQNYMNFKNKYQLVIAGAKGWKSKKLEERTKKNLEVKLLPNISDLEKSALLKNASVLIYPSFYEGFGFPVVEAFKNSLPVITSNRSSLPEITNNSAYLVNPIKPNEITEAIKNLLLNNDGEKLKTRFIEAGLKQIENFSWEKYAEKFILIVSQN